MLPRTIFPIHHLFSINEPSFGFHGIIYFWILLLKRNILVISRAYFNILSEKDENDDNYFGHYLPLVRHYFSGSIVLCHSMKHLFSLFSLSSPQRGGSVVLLAHTWPEAHMCIYQPFNIFFFHHRVSACTCTRSFKHMTGKCTCEWIIWLVALSPALEDHFLFIFSFKSTSDSSYICSSTFQRYPYRSLGHLGFCKCNGKYSQILIFYYLLQQ